MTLTWSDDLRLDQPLMDRTHREFVELLAVVRAAVDAGDVAAALSTFDRLHEHTAEHFAREERWMRAIGFEAENMHAVQHESVLKVMREVARLARDENRCEPLVVAITELTQWFPLHAQMMDGDLALCMKQAGFDPGAAETSSP